MNLRNNSKPSAIRFPDSIGFFPMVYTEPLRKLVFFRDKPYAWVYYFALCFFALRSTKYSDQILTFIVNRYK